jgi:hypothetical protein
VAPARLKIKTPPRWDGRRMGLNYSGKHPNWSIGFGNSSDDPRSNIRAASLDATRAIETIGAERLVIIKSWGKAPPTLARFND